MEKVKQPSFMKKLDILLTVFVNKDFIVGKTDIGLVLTST